MTAIASFADGCTALLAVFVAAPWIVRFALSLGAPEYFSMMFLGLVAAPAAASGDLFRSIGMVLPGLLIGLVGMDIVSGAWRFIFGIPILSEGLSFIVVAPNRTEARQSIGSALRGSGILAPEAADNAGRLTHGYSASASR